MDLDELAKFQALEIAGQVLILRLREAFPRFEHNWEEHMACWDGESPGSYLDISAFAHFIDEELFDKREAEEVKQALTLLDQLFVEGDELTRDLIGIGFVEDIQNYSGGRPNGHSTIIPLLPSTLLKVWKQIERQWAGHQSLMDVIEAEKAQSTGRRSTWSELLDQSDK